jgi:hypothetical protein
VKGSIAVPTSVALRLVALASSRYRPLSPLAATPTPPEVSTVMAPAEVTTEPESLIVPPAPAPPADEEVPDDRGGADAIVSRIERLARLH